MEKLEFLRPELRILKINASDIIVTSGDPFKPEGVFGNAEFDDDDWGSGK